MPEIGDPISRKRTVLHPAGASKSASTKWRSQTRTSEVRFEDQVRHVSMYRDAVWATRRARDDSPANAKHFHERIRRVRDCIVRRCTCTPRQEKNISNTSTVLRRIQEHQLFLQLPQSGIPIRRVTYLGFVAESGTVSAYPENAATIRTWPKELKSRKEVRSFLGLAGCSTKLVLGFNTRASPLCPLLRKSRTVLA